MTSVGDYFTAGADGVMIWNYGQNYYNTCPAPGNDYIVVTTDPLAAAIRSYVIT